MGDLVDLDEIFARIKQLVRDLETVRDGTSSQLFSPQQRDLHNKFVAMPGSLELIMQLKQVLDDLRQMIWLQLEFAAAGSAGEPEARTKLLQRAAEILCALSIHRPPAKRQFKSATGSYVDRVMELVESRMEKKKTEN